MADYIVITQIKGSLDPNDHIRVFRGQFGSAGFSFSIGRILIFNAGNVGCALYCFTTLISKLPSEVVITIRSNFPPGSAWFRLKTAALVTGDVRNSYLERFFKSVMMIWAGGLDAGAAR